MNLTEIKKLNKEMSMQSENFEFFRTLYQHCIKALEMVPDSFIEEVFKNTYETESIVDSITIGETYVRFDVYDKDEEDWKYYDYSVKETPFIFRDISMKIPLDNDEEVVQFYIADSYFTIRDLKRTFGKYLLRFLDNNFYVEVSIKCFN